ncbi:hypothetical protein [Gimesia panareensis]|uniref:hypothetical protein n=1 Tax=Gimesia panareensis TaxID=2527978 RepID=UPI00118838D3|nr:hypothetical protein [Gimesia panareensis]QDU49455.1 hypothetical protein Pan110_17920 [Gimesia panareensis]
MAENEKRSETNQSPEEPEESICPTCGGDGEIFATMEDYQYSSLVPGGSVCSTCGGMGRVSRS